MFTAVDAGILTPLTSAGEVCLVPVMPLAATENQDAVTQAVTMAAAAAEQGAQVVAAADVDVPILDVNASDLLGSEAPTHLITETGRRGNRYVSDLVQDCSNSSALELELLQFCTKPLMCK